MVDSSLFIYHNSHTTIYLLLYVDDIIITGNDPPQIPHLITALSTAFELKDLGALSYFLGIQIVPTKFGLTLCQSKYAYDILDRFHMENAKPTKTPCCSSTKPTASTSSSLSDPSKYRSMVVALQYLTFTHPNLAFSVHQLCQFMQKPTTTHLQDAKRVLQYVRGTLHHGIHFSPSPFTLSAFSNADWAREPSNRKSLLGISPNQ